MGRIFITGNQTVRYQEAREKHIQSSFDSESTYILIIIHLLFFPPDNPFLEILFRPRRHICKTLNTYIDVA